MKIVAISDTHNRHKSLTIPECDILIHAGDATGRGRESEVRAFAKWFQAQEAGYLVWVPGNHEKDFQDCLPHSLDWFHEECPDGHLLINRQIDIEGVKLYGSPVTPWFYDWAWNVYRKDIDPYWAAIPEDTDVLITHGPPAGILDICYQADGVTPRERVGCHSLYDRTLALPNLKHHIFGHIHPSHGHEELNGKHYWNVSICDDRYAPTNPITEIEL